MSKKKKLNEAPVHSVTNKTLINISKTSRNLPVIVKSKVLFTEIKTLIRTPNLITRAATKSQDLNLA